MTRNDILEVVKKHTLSCLDDIDPSSLTLDASLEDLGATSLDMVEIVSLSMRELRIKIPRSELENLPTVGAVVDAFEAALSVPS